jgi:hypothetical protein
MTMGHGSWDESRACGTMTALHQRCTLSCITKRRNKARFCVLRFLAS